MVFLSALLIGFTLLGNEPLSNARFESTELILPSIGGVEYRAERFSGVDLGNDSFSWTGKIKSARGGFVSLAVVNGESAVTVSFADGITYSFRGKLKNLVLKPLVSSHQVCGGCVAVADGKLPADPRMGAQPMLSWQNGDANLIDLLVVYPASVRSDAGGTSAIQAEIVKAVADSNLCYRNSQVNVQLRLVHMEEVSYTPTGMLETDLSRLKATNDGHIDNVHALRDSYGADLVALLTTASNSGGLASTLMHPSLDFESSGFSVNVWTQISAPSYTLAHEIGHNMGCLHNVEDSSGVTALYDFGAFCYGKRWMNSGQGVKTVMSYDTSPSSTYPTTIPYFSNPLVDYQGTLTGNAGSADNAQVLSSTAPYVSNFRTSVVQGILPEVFNLEVVEGNYSNLSVRLSAKPAHAVEVSLSSSGDSDLMLMSGTTLNFDSTNWNLPHTVQLYAKPDSDLTSDMGTLILSSNGMPSISVTLSEVDNSSNMISGVLLSGVVVNELGVGLGGVSLTLSNGGGQVITDAEGSFLLELSTNWSGAVTPLRDGFSFSPSTLNLGPISADSLGHSMVASRSDILYVHGTAAGAGDGTSWANAYTDLGDALRATTLFTEVWVATGTYKAGMVRSSTFLIPPNIAVYGGFSGNEVSRVNRDVLANVTILSGDLGILNNNTDNAFHVVVPSQGSVLDGFTITGGNASENFSDDRGKGAGLWADSASITVSNCKFISNNAYQGGAAIYLKDVNGTFSNCEIISNTTNSTGSGAGLYLEDSNVSFSSSIFSDNQAHFHAGAIRSENSEINLLNCSLSANRSLTSNGGGAMYLNGGIFSIKSTSFTNNQATFQGGAILISGASGSIEDSNFTGNQNTNSNGGGALLIENSSPSILRCRFIENSTSANNNGGAIKLDTSSPIISDSYFVRNQSLVNSAGAVFIDSTSNPIFSNNEFHHNSAAQSAGAVFIQTGSNPIFSDNQFHSNTSSFSGGAFYIDSSSNPIFSDNQFHSNISSQSGGAIFIDSTSNPSFSKNEFRLNSAAQFGGAIFVDGSNLNLNGDLFLGNYANYGGGIAAQGTMSVSLSNVRALGNEANSSSSSSAGFIYLNSDVTSSTFVNSVFSGNKSLGRYGVYRPNGPSRFVNCSIVGNQAGSNGGVTLMFTGDSIELDNCIVWNNTAGTGNDIGVNQGTATANYSLFNPSESIGIISGSNHQSNDPLFTDANGPDNIAGTLDDDLTLQAGSPAIDQGSSSLANFSTSDVLSRNRVGSPDMGAYEFASNSVPAFTSGNTFSLSENLTVVADLNASDLDGDAIVFSISGGVDQDQFSIEASTGLLSFVTAPDFETPIDNGGDNSYTVEVSVSDGSSTSTLLLTISVVDVSEQAPVQNFTLNLSASSGGSVSGAGSYVSGGNATLLATPESGYLFSSWSGDLNSTTNPLTLSIDSNLTLFANFVLANINSTEPDFYGPRTFAQILESNFTKAWKDGIPTRLSTIENRSHVILMDSSMQYCLSTSEGNMTGLQAITVSSLTDSGSTYGQVLRSMFQVQDLNIETQATNSLANQYTIRPELMIYSAVDANASTGVSTATSTLLRDIKSFTFQDQSTISYLAFSFNASTDSNATKVQAIQRYQFDSVSESFLPDSSWSASQWLKIGVSGVELVSTEGDGTDFYFVEASGLIDFSNTQGDSFNPASIQWQTNNFASWPTNPGTGQLDVVGLVDNPLMPGGRDYNEIDENYRLQFGTGESAKEVASAYLDQIEAALLNNGESLRYDKALYLNVRDNMLSHTIAAVDEYNAILGTPTVPFVYFTNAQDSNGTYHPFMVVGAINGTGGPNFLIDVARPPGDGSSPQYSQQTITRNAFLSTVLARIPLKDYGLISSLSENDLSSYNSLIEDSGTGGARNVYNYASTSVNGIAVDGVKIYPAMNNTLVFAPTNAEITSTGVHVGRGMGLHYHADGHSFNGNGINLYNIEDYEGHAHPPIIGFALDGLALYGKYEDAHSGMHGYGDALDEYGSHSHDGYGHHYHAFSEQVTNEWQGNDYTFTEHFLLAGAYRGSINAIPDFQNIGTNQLKDSTLGKYVGALGTYVNTNFPVDSNESNSTFYSLTLTASVGGSVSGGGNFAADSNATLLATPNPGYLFINWSGDLNSTDNPLYLTVDSNLSLLANFTLDSNESLPFDFNASTLEVAENSPIDSVVGHMHRTSGEENASVTYTLEYNGSLDAPPFRIESNGTILTTGILDFETQSQYTVEIVGITENNQTATHFFSVYVLDINESGGGNVDSNESGYGVARNLLWIPAIQNCLVVEEAVGMSIQMRADTKWAPNSL